jgi:microcystin-dependent protein
MAAHKDLSGIDLHEPKGIDDATSGQYYAADGAGSGTWTSLAGGLVIPEGIMVDYAGTSAPSLWLMCYGQAISRTTYSALFTAIGTTHGTGDGSTTFNLPDCRGRVVAGQDDMGGSSANRLTGVTGSVNGDTMGAVGGEETHTLTEAELAAHDHGATGLTTTITVNNGSNIPQNLSDADFNTYSAAAGSHDVFDGVSEDIATITATGTIGGDTADAGSGSAHNNVQPTIILNKIIYAGV